MVSREDCVSTINRFIEKKNIKDVVTLFEYLCELKEVNQPEAIKQVSNNPALIGLVLPKTIDLLTEILGINKITDKHNNLITVY